MRVKFTTKVLRVDINVDLTHKSDNLHVVGVIEDLNTRDGSTRNQPTAMALFGAPDNFLTLRVTNGRIDSGRSENTEV